MHLEPDQELVRIRELPVTEQGPRRGGTQCPSEPGAPALASGLDELPCRRASPCSPHTRPPDPDRSCTTATARTPTPPRRRRRRLTRTERPRHSPPEEPVPEDRLAHADTTIPRGQDKFGRTPDPHPSIPPIHQRRTTPGPMPAPPEESDQQTASPGVLSGNEHVPNNLDRIQRTLSAPTQLVERREIIN